MFFATAIRHRPSIRSSSLCGFSLLSSIVSVGILGTIGVGVPILVAGNQNLRTTALHNGQAYYTTRASFEYGLRQIYVDGDPDVIPTRQFADETFSINREDSKIKVVGIKGDASIAFSVTDPFPPNEAKCLDIDASGAVIPGPTDDLEDVYVSHAASTPVRCTDPVTIVSMIVSWTPLTGQLVEEIEFDDFEVYDDDGQPSGSTFIFSSPYTFNVSTNDELEIEWTDDLDANSTVTIIFNMQDGSSKTVVVTDTS